MRADYVIGCDGGRSSVRKLAGIELRGLHLSGALHQDRDDLRRRHAQSQSGRLRNYFSDPNEWCNLFKVQGKGRGGLWRAIFPIQDGEDDETALLARAGRGAPAEVLSRSRGRYEIEYVNVYGVHQRVAATFRIGRVLLAGDSAHLNNPIGGMGMNGGIHDGINLADKLARVIHGEAGDELLDLYSRQRRHAAVKYVQAQTIANKRLMEERDPAVRKTNFDELRRTAENPGNRQGLYAPRRAVRQPARRRRGDLTRSASALRRRAPQTHILRTVTPIVSDIIEQARLAARAFAEFGEHLIHPTVRLGVTGLSRAGKTVFITALLHGLLRGGRFPVFEPLASGRIAGARLAPQPDDAVPRFDYERHVRSVVIEREWPQSTRQISELRVVIDYQSASGCDAHADARHRRLSRRMAARPAAARTRATSNGRRKRWRYLRRTTRPPLPAAFLRTRRVDRSARDRPTSTRRSKRRGCSPTICRPAARSTRRSA